MSLSFEEVQHEQADSLAIANRLANSVEKLFSSGAALALVQKSSEKFAPAIWLELLPGRDGQQAFREVVSTMDPDQELSVGAFVSVPGVSLSDANLGRYQWALDTLKNRCQVAIDAIRSGDKWRARQVRRWPFPGRGRVIQLQQPGLIAG